MKPVDSLDVPELVRDEEFQHEITVRTDNFMYNTNTDTNIPKLVFANQENEPRFNRAAPQQGPHRKRKKSQILSAFKKDLRHDLDIRPSRETVISTKSFKEKNSSTVIKIQFQILDVHKEKIKNHRKWTFHH